MVASGGACVIAAASRPIAGRRSGPTCLIQCSVAPFVTLGLAEPVPHSCREAKPAIAVSSVGQKRKDCDKWNTTGSACGFLPCDADDSGMSMPAVCFGRMSRENVDGRKTALGFPFLVRRDRKRCASTDVGGI